jgi:A-macroglobulin TED domain/A-macroglobulin receptor binding domain
MDLIAEVLLLGNDYGWADLPEIEGNQYGSETESLFRDNIKNGIYAANRSIGDAIEKTLTVHPDGMERHLTVSGIIRGSDNLTLRIPHDFISGSLQAKLKIYPNLLAHVTESIEAGLERPYGCGEQTISSTYPSVLLLKYYKASGISSGPLQSRANRYLNLGYHRLLNYREPTGGFSYWGHGSSDVALTAYAVRFLSDASGFIEVDPEIIQDAEKWLVGQQNKEGSWQPRYGEDDHSLTAYVTATLAESQNHLSEPLKKSVHDAVTRALAHLADPHRRLSDPYALAEFAIALKLNGEEQRASAVATNLSNLATPEHGGMYWALERNTPFYGWGNTGRIESTAMAILALSLVTPGTVEGRQLIEAGTLWLLQQKDRYGVWYSGQATVNVLEALLKSVDSSRSANTSATLSVTVNGHVKPLQVSLRADAPILLDISDLIQPGENGISVQGSGGLTAASVQVVTDFYVPWGGTASESTRLGKAEALRLAVHFDKTDVRAGDEVRCAVDAERIGSRGWGMMIAEIGLPPGADVDRRVLDDVISNSGWEVSHYDLLPDKLVLYLWPRAGGTKLTFSFHPRYGLRGRTAPSVLYDYYNPDAEVDIAPADFRVETNAASESQKVASVR